MKPNNPNIIIVDDDDDARESLAWYLRTMNYNVYNYADGYMFLDDLNKLSELKHKCLILDLRMPKISGLEIQQKLNEVNAHIPIIFLSAYANENNVVKAIRRGAIDFLSKPYRDEELLQAINNGLEVSLSF